MSKLLQAAVLATMASGCIVVNNDHHSGAGGDVPPSSTTTYQVALALGTTVNPGVQAGYGLTANSGGSYRLVWTGDSASSGTEREFYGSIWTRGSFVSVSPGCSGACPLESDDFVSDPISVAGGQRVDFDTFATDGLDGLDFVVTNAEPNFRIYVDAFIDGVHYPNLVFFPSAPDSGQVSSVAVIPFSITQ